MSFSKIATDFTESAFRVKKKTRLLTRMPGLQSLFHHWLALTAPTVGPYWLAKRAAACADWVCGGAAASCVIELADPTQNRDRDSVS
nr:hypothetical protein [Gammaproteobacteria bacterium]